MEKVFTSILMGKSTKVNGKKIGKMDSEEQNGQTDHHIEANMRMAISMGKESLYIKMVQSTKVISFVTKYKDLGHISLGIKGNILENG